MDRWMEGEMKGIREAWADQPANDLTHTEITRQMLGWWKKASKRR